MITIKPFKAFVPKKNSAQLVSTRQINSYSDNTLKKVIQTNPESFLQIIMPDFFSKEKIRTTDKFKKINTLFQNAIEDGLFVTSSQESFYIYRQSNPNQSYTGLIAGASTKDYRDDKIKKHEHTLEKREKLFTKYLRLTGFNAEPILLMHKKSIKTEIIIERIANTEPLHRFTSSSGNKHELWEINNEKDITEIQDCFAQMKEVYIADGHHRSASSNLLSLENPELSSTDNVMALFMSEENIVIHDFNRVLKNSENKSEQKILEELQANFTILEKSGNILEPAQKHEFCVYLFSTWYRLKLNKTFDTSSSTVSQLDPQIVTDFILAPIFNIKDLKNDNRIDFIPGNKGLDSLKQAVDDGKFDLAIAMFPVGVDELKQIADEGLVMPPKSTFIEPKLRSGLTVYKF
ncbi:MAG: DUF1015 domain-containing protein [Flavobacteriales bacterium]